MSNMLSSVVPSFCSRQGTLRLWTMLQRRPSAPTTTTTTTLFQGAAAAIQGKHACTPTRSWSTTVPVHARLFSSARPLDVESGDVAHADSRAADGNDACPSVRVLQGGKAVLIRFPAAAASAGAELGAAGSAFDAAWLWSNCPSAVLPDSGQRTRTPGQFPGWKIASASILDAERIISDSTNSAVAESGDDPLYLPIPPPPPGSAHPILGNNLFRGVASPMSSQKMLRVDWDTAANNGGGSSQFMYPSTSYFDIGWLQQWRYDNVALARRRRRSEVTMDIAIPNVEHDTDSGLFEVPYENVVAALGESRAIGSRKDCGLFALLRSIFTDGAAVMTNVPSKSIIDDSGSSISPVEVVGKAIGGGRLSHGALYGDIFHVKSIPSAHNIAYTSQHLAPHQDLAYYESPPGIQLLHCVGVSPTLVGAESVLIDGMAAAERLRHLAPDYFRTLATCPATFVKQRDGACMTYQRPHIVLKEDGSGQDCIDREIVGVNWSPPFEGPISIRQDLVSSYFRAYAAFEYMLDNSLPLPPPRDHLLSQAEIHEFASYSVENTWLYQLRPGQMLVFNNLRMLHGRRGFADDSDAMPEVDVGAKPIRHLVGAYTNIDDTLCQYRVLLQEVGEPSAPIPNVGNGTTSSVP